MLTQHNMYHLIRLVHVQQDPGFVGMLASTEIRFLGMIWLFPGLTALLISPQD